MASAESPQIDIKLNHMLSKKNVTIMLIGAAGAGKSSLINSLIKLVQLSDLSPDMKINNYIPTATAQLMGGHTMMREPVDLTDTLTIIDNRGWHDWTNATARQELIAQIRGERSLDDDVNWEDGAEDELSVAVYPKVDCISIVINGEGGIEAMEGISELIRTCRQNIKRIPSVVITHMDGVTDEQIESMKAELVSYAIEPQSIFVVQNVTPSDDNLEANSALSLCKFFERCNIDGDAGANYHERKEAGNLKRDDKLKEIEDKKKSKEIDDLKHDFKRQQQNEAMMQLQVQTEIEKDRKAVESEIMQAKKKHVLVSNEMDEKCKQQSNKFSNERYAKYLDDLYTVRLNKVKNT